MKRSSSRGSATPLAFVAAAAEHVAGALAGLVLIPVIAHTLGVEALGAWTLLGTCSFLLGVSDLGLSTCVQRAVAADDREGARRLVGLTLAAIGVCSPLLALLAALMLDGALASLLGGSRHVITLVALIAGIVSAIAFPFRGYLLVRGGMRTLALARGLGSAGQVTLTIVLMQVTRSLLAPALALLLATAIETCITVRGALAHDPELPVLPRLPRDARWAMAALKEGSATLAINGASLAAQRVDVLLLSAVAPLGVVAAYGVVSRVIDQAYVLAKQVSAAMLPRLATPSDRPAAVRLGTGVMGVLVASGMPALALDGRPILVAWGGAAAGGAVASTVAILLAAAAIVAASQEVAASALTMTGSSVWQSARCLIAGTILNVVISLLGARFAGPAVIAGATVAGNLLTAVLIWKNVSKLLGWRASDAISTLSPVIVAALASTLLAWATAEIASGSIRMSMAMAAASAAAGVVAGGAWALWRAFPRVSAREPAPLPAAVRADAEQA